jgi:hypothetical protein
MNNKIRKNYSQDDIRRLINEGMQRADYINKIIDDDIHLNMTSESYQPIYEKLKYIKNKNNINNKQNYYLSNNFQRKIINNFNNFQKYRYYPNESQNILKNENNRYLYNKNNYNGLNNSLIINRPINSEKKHFPLLSNRGNYLKIHNNIPFIDRQKLIRSHDNDVINDYNNNLPQKRGRYKYNYNNDDNYKGEEFKSYEYNPTHNIIYKAQNLKGNDSILNLSSNLPKINIKNKLNEKIEDFDYEEDLEEKNYVSRNGKHYNPRRYDYEGSRFGDDTYNFYLNEPMRGDINSVWKFPPVYYYNSRIDYRKSFPNY